MKIDDFKIPTVSKPISLGRLSGEMISDVINGRIMDTRIDIEGGTLCFVAGEEREKFIEELNDVILKFQI